MSLPAAIVAGASVALVGNSEKILSPACKAGRNIDSADVVIRMNRGLPALIGHPDKIGTKTTIWATAKFWPDAMIPAECGSIIWMKRTPLGRKQLATMRAAVNLINNSRTDLCVLMDWPQEWEDECRAFVGADPGTGIRMLWWLRKKADPRSISCYGMDCWDAPSHWSGKRNTPNHSPTLEHAAMMKLL